MAVSSIQTVGHSHPMAVDSQGEKCQGGNPNPLQRMWFSFKKKVNTLGRNVRIHAGYLMTSKYLVSLLDVRPYLLSSLVNLTLVLRTFMTLLLARARDMFSEVGAHFFKARLMKHKNFLKGILFFLQASLCKEFIWCFYITFSIRSHVIEEGYFH